MGKGIDIAREIFGAPEHAALLDDLKDQLLIVFQLAAVLHELDHDSSTLDGAEA